MDRTLFAGLALLVLTSCNIKEEGCLDIRATNFAFDADKPCSDCCNYPRLYLRVSHVWNDTTPFRQNQVYETRNNDTFRIDRLDYVFSGFILTDDNGQEQTVQEGLLVWCDQNGMIEQDLIRDDLIVINLTNLNYEIGTFASDDLFQQGRCVAGFAGTYACAIADSVQNSGPLSNESFLYDQVEMNRYFGRMIIQKDTSVNISDTLFIPNIGLDLAFSLNRSFTTGRPDTIFCTVQYQEWFESIALKQQSNEEILQQLTINLPNGIFLE